MYRMVTEPRNAGVAAASRLRLARAAFARLTRWNERLAKIGRSASIDTLIAVSGHPISFPIRAVC